MLTALLMAGGKGERFWPASRMHHPKQLLPISSDRSMMEETILRLDPLIPLEKIFISTGRMIADEVRMTLPAILPGNYIIEPVGRNTAPCIGLSALLIRQRLGDVAMAVLPADHVIPDKNLFQRTLRVASELAREKQAIVTIGIKPQSAHTGYGYIKHRRKITEVDSLEAFELERFTEKPDLPTANYFLSEGDYLWNSGIFIWTCETILEEIKRHLPELHRILEAIRPKLGTVDEQRAIDELFPSAPPISIDYGVMEKTDRGIVIKGCFTWDDVGSWSALERLHPADERGNVIRGLCSTVDTDGCIIQSDRLFVGTVGVKDLVIIATDDAILVCHKSRSEDLKKLTEQLNKTEYLKKYL
jgi:mannose-1-phosphate guanylyltransferase